MNSENKKTTQLIAVILFACFLLVVVGLRFFSNSGPETFDEPTGSANSQVKEERTIERVEPTEVGLEKPPRLDPEVPVDPEIARIEAELLKLLRAIGQPPYDREDLVRLQQLLLELEDYVAGLDPKHAPLVLELLDAEENFLTRFSLIKGLGYMGGDIAAQGLADHYVKLSESDSLAEIQRTVDALGEIDNDASYGLIEDLIYNSRPKDRFRFVKALGNHSRRGDAVPLMLELAREEPGDRLRNKAAQALKKAADPHSAPEIERMLDTEKSQYVRQTMIGALGAIGDPKSLRVLKNIALNDPEVSTRLSAINAIRKIGTEEALPILEQVAEKDKEPRLRDDAKRFSKELQDQG